MTIVTKYEKTWENMEKYRKTWRPIRTRAPTSGCLKCCPWYGNILEILWKYSGNKTSILWKRSRFSSGLSSLSHNSVQLSPRALPQEVYTLNTCHVLTFQRPRQTSDYTTLPQSGDVSRPSPLDLSANAP